MDSFSCVGSAFDDGSISEGGLIAGGVRVRQGRQPNYFTALELMNIPMLTPRVEAGQPRTLLDRLISQHTVISI